MKIGNYNTSVAIQQHLDEKDLAIPLQTSAEYPLYLQVA